MNRRRVYNALCIHWDHHPLDDAQHYGAGTDAEQIRRYLRIVKPDTTQYHALGCFGYASFSSAIAPLVPGLVGDPLRIWAQVCTDEDVPFGCYVASFDCQSPLWVPQWRCINQAGQVSGRYYCPNGPWTEEFFIPFLLEVMERYHPAHFWLDGVWLPANREDYCHCSHCQRRFQRQYGRSMPDVPKMSDWFDVQEFHEQALDDAVSRIARAVKRRDPNILLACNNLYFFKDVRKPVPEVDWLSWDALNTPNVHRASFESTYISTAGQRADIMIYDQGIVRWQPEILRRPRTLAQLKTEAGIILAHGARVNLWHDPNPDGSIPIAKAETARQIAEFVRERQAWCVDGDSAAEVAVLASRLDHCADPQHQDIAVRAVQHLLQEGHIPCDVVRDEALLNRLVQYQLVVLPQTRALDLDTALWLHQYVLDGGCILLIATEPFGDDMGWQEALLGEGVTLMPSSHSGDEAEWEGRLIQLGHRQFDVSHNWRCLIPYHNTGAPWLAELTAGDGSILAITSEAASDYAETHWPPLRDMVTGTAFKGIGQLPLVEMHGHPGIELVVNRRGSDLYVHLVNLTPGTAFGAPAEVFFDEVPIYRDIALTVRPPHQPDSITLLPGGDSLLRSVESSECEDPVGHCTLRIVIPELSHHLAVRLGGALDGESR